MPPKRHIVGSLEEWLRYAEADIAFAKVPLPDGGMYEQLCFHTQQAAEKALKGVLISRGVDFPSTHNLRALVDLMPLELELPPAMLRVTRLSAYAVTFRYPGEGDPISKKEYREALRIAKAIVK